MLKLRVESIRWDAGDTATFFLSEVTGKPVSYQAGQFITLVFEHHGEELRRSYSISSSPGEPYLAITVKRVPNGELSRFLLTHAKVGNVWNAIAPTGKFLLKGTAQQQDIFFFAAGSGITPVRSQIKYLLDHHSQCCIQLIYSNRNANSILFKAELDEWQLGYPENFRVVYLLSDEANRLNNVKAEQLVRQHLRFDLEKALFYLCGPFDYMRMLRLTLIYMGVPEANIRKENFVLDTVPVAESRLNFAPHKVRIITGNETHDIIAGENQSILQAALQNNIKLPYSCRAGICSSCSVKCTGGKVAMTQNEVLTNADLAEGWVLTCTGYAMDDSVVIVV